MTGLLKDEAIVLRKSPVGDYDLSLTLYMRRYGKENVYIPKGQIIKSPYVTVSEPFSWFKAVFIRKKDKIFIKEIDRSKNLGIEISKDLQRFQTGYEMINLFNSYIIFPDEKMFVFLKKSVYYLSKGINSDLFKLNFAAKLIFLSGIYPQTEECVKCGTKMNKKNFRYLSINEGGVLCISCSNKKGSLNYADIKTIQVLKYITFKDLQKLNIKNPQKIYSFYTEYLKKNL